ncbi:hypothetical protein TWF730_008264 [Orbilia blumenaviensis]|uniref:F-box domain-containing protein n=1 Tax=Orbilia blumenaviensis TaxID=1796055 RepID=A0AAV9V1Z3_9PEZI
MSSQSSRFSGSRDDTTSAPKLPPFLSLPREIRDEIYSYLLLFNPPEAFHVYLDRPVEMPYLAVCLLRVNEQIHDEASEFLYSRNTFPILIRIGSFISHNWRNGDEEGNKTGHGFRTGYSSHWEHFDHQALLPQRFHELIKMSAQTTVKMRMQENDGIRHPDEEVPPIPAPRYCCHIRRLKVDVLDYRTSGYLTGPTIVPPDIRPTLQTLFQPFTHRLKNIFERAGDSLKIDIDVISVEHMRNTGRLFINKSSDQTHYEKRRGGPATDRRADAYYFPVYGDLVRMVWPFTTGPWRYGIRTHIDGVFGDKTQSIIEDCNQNAVLDGSIMECRPYFVASGFYWVSTSGKRFVQVNYGPGFW